MVCIEHELSRRSASGALSMHINFKRALLAAIVFAPLKQQFCRSIYDCIRIAVPRIQNHSWSSQQI